MGRVAIRGNPDADLDPPVSVVTQPRTRSASCLNCRHPFEPTRDWSRFCGDSCRVAHWRRTREIKTPIPVVVGMGVEGQIQQTSATNLSLPSTRIKSRLWHIATALAHFVRGMP